MQPLSPHQSSCHPSIPSSPPPQASAPLFLLGRGTKTGCNYCLQVFTYSHILMEPNCWSFHNPKIGLNLQLRKKKKKNTGLLNNVFSKNLHTTYVCANKLHKNIRRITFSYLLQLLYVQDSKIYCNGTTAHRTQREHSEDACEQKEPILYLKRDPPQWYQYR